MYLDLSDLSDDGVPRFRYIHDLHKYAPFFRCGKCSQLWKYSSYCARHEATCDTQTKRVYPDGYFRVSSTVFERMNDVGVSVPQDLRIFPHFITYDFESRMVDPGQVRAGFEAEHVPISFSLCSNISGLTLPAFRAHPDPTQLVTIFVDLLEDWSAQSYALLKPTYQPYLEQLEKKAKHIVER